MKIWLNELLLCNLAVVLFIAVIVFLPSSILRLVLGVPLIVFLPGYSLTAALFPRKSALAGTERVALSFGMSIAIIGFTGIFLNFTPWGIKLYPVLIFLTVFNFLASAVAQYRRWRLGAEGKFNFSLNLTLPSWHALSPLSKGLSFPLILVILGTLGATAYMLAVPKVGEHFTEFYILNQDGKMEGYPQELRVGQEAVVQAVIINHEYTEVTYFIEVKPGSNIQNSVKLGHDQKWMGEVSFKMTSPAGKQKVEFILYKENEPYHELSLWINVTG